METKNTIKSNKGLVFGAVLAAAFGFAQIGQASVITDDLGSAAQFSLLQYNTSNVSDSAFQGGAIGVVNGNWVQSGGGQTNMQQPETVYLSPGFTNGGPVPPLSTSVNFNVLNTAWNAATSASTTFAGEAATVPISSINGNTTITETAVGNYVLKITSFADNSNLTLSAPAGSTFVLNITTGQDIHLNSNTWSLAGGLTANDVVYNFLGGTGLQTAGGGNGTVITGIVLDTTGAIQLHPGEVDGEVIAQTFTSSSGALIVKSPMIPEANPGWALIPFVSVALFAFARRQLQFAA